MRRVRFLRAKRYPHPDGPKRHPGDEIDLPKDLADAWIRGGLVEPAPTPSTPARDTKPQVRPKPTPQARTTAAKGKPAARKRRR